MRKSRNPSIARSRSHRSIELFSQHSSRSRLSRTASLKSHNSYTNSDDSNFSQADISNRLSSKDNCRAKHSSSFRRQNSTLSRQGSRKSRRGNTQSKKKEVVISTTKGLENKSVSLICKNMVSGSKNGKQGQELLVSTWIDEDELSL